MIHPVTFLTHAELMNEFLDDVLETGTNCMNDCITPLHAAVYRNDQESVRIILQHLTRNVEEYKYVTIPFLDNHSQ